MKKITFLALMLVISMVAVFTACKKDDTPDPNAGKATITDLAVTPGNRPAIW